MGCKHVRLSDVAILTPGFAFKSKDFGNYDAKAIKITDISDDCCSSDLAGVNIDEYSLAKMKKYLVHPGDYFLAMTGSIGKVGRITVGSAYLNQRVLGVQPSAAINKGYLWHLLNSNDFKNHLLTHIDSHSVQANISAKSVGSFEFDLPERNTQDAIASILGSFDSKIQCNTRLNGYLGEQCEAIASHEKGHIVELASLCDLVKDKADYSEANFDTYVSTESLLPGKKGRQTPSSLPQAGKITVYKVGDILVSNIRPYFKKIWYADQAGTCSGDVLVFRAKQPGQSGYLYSRMRSDTFFDYVMKGAKGTKMPRGDKKQMLTYKVGGNPNGATIDYIESALNQASSISKENRKLAALRDALLPKLMSGEINVSKIDLMQLNSHLA